MAFTAARAHRISSFISFSFSGFDGSHFWAGEPLNTAQIAGEALCIN
jgi:hypothetical protein